jgi:hypothetical protein
MTNHTITRFWLWGGLTGLLLPIVPSVLLTVLSCLPIALGQNFLGVLVIFSLAILEWPAVSIGRMLNLPIESGSPAFIICSLTPFGYILVVVFWIFVGLLVGSAVDRILSVKITA